MSPAHDERSRIQAAMARIISGRPEKSNGALTIVALATEADVPRNALTQRHLDLKNLFYEKVRANGGTPDSERRLRRETARLKRLREDDKKLIRQLKADNETLVGTLHLAQLQNEELRRRLAESGGIVHAIRTS
ncbi:hypothetical protein HAV21_20845 [Paenarthrobacter sp. MSM-2-10-13]|uniref:hypothetical protein n=1 Tax=Paenarthrobacter TaxID=1742992 RepID=UPI0008A6E80C|nr:MULTISPECIES: hypothetical protein [Paenarthrobacter]AOY70952.1 hypothetical protein ARZXY2_1399 [Arthrobacter sp. ZXY-2]NHW49308.1 hypothetical protein [Paenarthrobacter sp. MSM-2-10-13]GLU60951.1 hypothetical protein Pure01_34640 [Paenarthrobacter ureafaciens]GLU65221.1 hypothetical protein Pure02_34710 [Paenarthrobacter ureafaciens]GLU69346.1 hypothetical protein Pure03_33220 [Paenarthrobacter ureafaciens]